MSRVDPINVMLLAQTPIFGAPVNNTVFGGGSNFNANFDRYLIFDVLQACKLKTVKVVANAAGRAHPQYATTG